MLKEYFVRWGVLVLTLLWEEHGRGNIRVCMTLYVSHDLT